MGLKEKADQKTGTNLSFHHAQIRQPLLKQYVLSELQTDKNGKNYHVWSKSA